MAVPKQIVYKIVELCRQGIPTEEVANRYKVNPSTVKRFARQYGVTLKGNTVLNKEAHWKRMEKTHDKTY